MAAYEPVLERAKAMKTDYLTIDHADAFVDFPSVEEKRATWLRFEKREPLAECPKCKGRGGWNLRINDCPLPANMENTRENRHRYCHFQASCSQCSGWGFVSHQRDVDCVHEPVQTAHDGNRCLTNYRCSKCGYEYQVDSSG